ncbi:structural toxin protein RtxA [Legionella spiritensis]|uniref:Structural toxin protein RtxA n=2 Tax=Legionella spiritensis TaxID=452 RepID=A0A0W0ZAW3_LEGSP|nr:structural toxin protein RtxA [Legionella spiritensis]SNV35054.1 structural toxin protein RtxA [Legionella spiritensis]
MVGVFMVVPSLSGVVQGLEGILIKNTRDGGNEVAKLGTPVHQGDILTLLSGNAYIHMLEGFPEALALNRPVQIDGISPLLKAAPQESLVEQIVDEALAKGIDPTIILNVLEETAAGEETIGEGGRFFVLDPLYGVGAVTAGYPTVGVSVDTNSGEQHVFFYEPDSSEQASDFVSNPDVTETTPFAIGVSSVSVDESDGLATVVNRVQSSTAASEITSVELSTPDSNAAVWHSGTQTLTATDGSWQIMVVRSGNNEINYEFKQLTPLQHPDASDPNDAITVPITVTATRNDGASATDRFSVTIYDDGPKIEEALVESPLPLNVDETNISSGNAVATVNYFNTFAGAVHFGMDDTLDHPGELVFSLGVTADQVASGLYANDPSAVDGKGVEIQLIEEGGAIRGIAGGIEYFTISIDSNSGEMTFAQSEAIWHGNPANPDDLASLNTPDINDLFIRVTAIDGDGDKASYQLGLGQGIFSINDDGPGIDPGLIVAADPLNVDETNLATGNAVATANYADNFQPAIDYGEDGAGQTVYELSLNGQPGSGLYAIDPNQANGQGDEIQLVQVDSHTVQGQVNGETYFTVTVDGGTGEVTFAQNRAVWHSDSANANDLSTLTTANADDFTIRAIVTDADGDSVEQALNLGQGTFSINDDGPLVNGNTDTAQLVYEDALPAGNADPGQTLNISGSLSSLVDFGADGPGGFELTTDYLTTLAAFGLTSDGQALSYSASENNGIQSVVAKDYLGQDVFTFTFDKTTGNYDFTLQSHLDHLPPPIAQDDDTQSLPIQLGAIINAIDADGDKVNLGQSFGVHVQDDLPVAQNDSVSVNEPNAQLNIYYVVDVSGSMGVVDPLIGQSRLELAREALVNLTQEYANYNGEVFVTVVPFASGSGNSGAFATAKFDILHGELVDALNFIGNLQVSQNPIPGSGTEYNDALDVTQDNLELDLNPLSQVAGYQNVVYFLSDGVPVPASAGAPAGWQSFVDTNNIDVIPIGIGDFNPGPLEEVGNTGDTVIQVLDPTDLSSTLIEQLDNVVQGNVLDNDAFGGDGPDVPSIVSVSYQGVDHDYDGVNNSVTIIDDFGGRLTFDFTSGDYSYIAPGVDQDEQVQFQYTIRDNDGDLSTANLNIVVNHLDPPSVTLLTKTLEFTRTEQGQQPYGNADVAEYLLLQALGNESQQVTSVPINGVNLSNTFISVATEPTVNFVSEGAGYRNMVGYYTYDSDGNINDAGFIWVNSSASSSAQNPNGGTNLITNTSGAFGFNQSASFTLPDVSAGEGLGFFLLADGANDSANVNIIRNGNYDSIQSLNNNVSIVNNQVLVGGQALNGSIYFTHDKTLNSDYATFPEGHALSGVTFSQDPSLTAYSGLLIIGFEDVHDGGDQDYNDVIFSVDLGANIQNYATDSSPIIESVTDPDSAYLTKAVVTTDGFIEGDTLNFLSNANVQFDTVNNQVTVTYNGADHVLNYTLTPDGNDPDFIYTFAAADVNNPVPVGAYEMALKSISFTPVASEASEGVARDVYVTVTDDTGLSATQATSFNVVINDILPMDLLAFDQQNEFDFGQGNDTVLIPDQMDGLGQVSGGQGIDTVKFTEEGMNLTAEEIQDHFNGHWEQIDMTEQGSNILNLDLEAVLKLSSGSELNLQLNNGENVSVLQIKADGTDSPDGSVDTVNIDSAHVTDVSDQLPAAGQTAAEQLFKLTNADASQTAYVHVVSLTQQLPEVHATSTDGGGGGGGGG